MASVPKYFGLSLGMTSNGLVSMHLISSEEEGGVKFRPSTNHQLHCNLWPCFRIRGQPCGSQCTSLANEGYLLDTVQLRYGLRPYFWLFSPLDTVEKEARAGLSAIELRE